MKKIFLTLAIFLSMFSTVFADVMPVQIDTKYTKTYGVYQAKDNITLYKEPDESSKIITNIRWTPNAISQNNMTFDDLFYIFIPSKYLGLMLVTDETDDWIEIIYNNSTGAKGWVKKDDPYRFSTWTNFYNMYGRKYGLKILKNAPVTTKELRSSTDDNAQIIAKMNIPSKIKLNVIRGNWALVSVMDIDKTSKTGYMRWRSDNGVRYVIPDIK